MGHFLKSDCRVGTSSLLAMTLIFGFVTAAFAGPVDQKKSFDDMVKESHQILLVQRDMPFQDPADPLNYKMKIVAVLYSDGFSNFQPGEKIDAREAGYANRPKLPPKIIPEYNEETGEPLEKPAAAPEVAAPAAPAQSDEAWAPRYVGLDGTTRKTPELLALRDRKFIVFVLSQGYSDGSSHWEFTAEGAYEPLSQLEAVKQKLGSHTTPTP